MPLKYNYKYNVDNYINAMKGVYKNVIFFFFNKTSDDNNLSHRNQHCNVQCRILKMILVQKS